MIKIKKHSVAQRVVTGVLIGVFVSALYIAFFKFQGGYDIFSKLSLATVLVFVIMGILTGLSGILTKHPIFRFKINWFIRGAFMGTLVMTVFILLSYDEFKSLLSSPLISWSGIESPFWGILDGTFIGALMGYIETKTAGEGKELDIS